MCYTIEKMKYSHSFEYYDRVDEIAYFFKTCPEVGEFWYCSMP